MIKPGVRVQATRDIGNVFMGGVSVGTYGYIKEFANNLDNYQVEFEGDEFGGPPVTIDLDWNTMTKAPYRVGDNIILTAGLGPYPRGTQGKIQSIRSWPQTKDYMVVVQFNDSVEVSFHTGQFKVLLNQTNNEGSSE